MVQNAFDIAVGCGWVTPTDFWRLHPSDYWWLYDLKIFGPDKAEDNEKWDRLLDILEKAKARENGR